MTVNDAGRATSADSFRYGGQPESAEFIQLLTPEGERVENPDYPLEISAEEIRALYRDLVLVRRIDFEAIALQRQGELGIWASLLGQEAAQVGSGRALGPRDMAFPTYREHGVAWCRGLDPAKLLELFRGVSHGGWDPKAHNFHLYTIVIGSQTLHATGYAMGIQRDGAVGEDGEAVIAYFGDGATSQGDVNEAFIWASVTNAPVVFFCQNNQWAISEPLERQSRVAAVPAGARLRLPRRPGRRQRRAGLPGGHQEGDAGGPGRPGADPDRGVHLPDGRAHHDRRPDPVPAGRGARDVEAQGPDRAGQGVPGPQRPGGREVLHRSGRRSGRARRENQEGVPGDARPRPAGDLRERLRRAQRAARGRARPVRHLPRRPSRRSSR